MSVIHKVTGESRQLEPIIVCSSQTLRGEQRVQVIPFSIGAHVGADNNFEFLEFGESSLQTVVFVEGLTGNFYQERAADV